REHHEQHGEVSPVRPRRPDREHGDDDGDDHVEGDDPVEHRGPAFEPHEHDEGGGGQEHAADHGEDRVQSSSLSGAGRTRSQPRGGYPAASISASEASAYMIRRSCSSTVALAASMPPAISASNTCT